MERRPLTFRYCDSCERTTRRTVEPAKLVYKERSWYVRAWCRERADWRTFKVIRMEEGSLELGEDTFEPRPLPPDLADSRPTGREERLVLLFSGDEGRVREEFDPAAIERLGDGRLRVELHAEPTERARRHLLSFGASLYVEEPAHLRAWLRNEAAALVRRCEEGWQK